jgi:hypothetical protein
MLWAGLRIDTHADKAPPGACSLLPLDRTHWINIKGGLRPICQVVAAPLRRECHRSGNIARNTARPVVRKLDRVCTVAPRLSAFSGRIGYQRRRSVRDFRAIWSVCRVAARESSHWTTWSDARGLVRRSIAAVWR